jgi:hypothetical protein
MPWVMDMSCQLAQPMLESWQLLGAMQGGLKNPICRCCQPGVWYARAGDASKRLDVCAAGGCAYI